MSKYTKGPWDNDLNEHDEPYQDIVVRAGYMNICRVWIDDAPVHDYNEQQKANARLISAAPDLLEALKDMTDMMDCGDEHGEGSPWHIKAKAAIAKAIGETP